MVTILGKHNKRTSVFNMYRLEDTSIERSGPITIIKQQWLLIQQKNRTNIHPHDAAITDLIISIKRKQKDHHEIIVTIDGNESFVSSKGGKQDYVKRDNCITHSLTTTIYQLTSAST